MLRGWRVRARRREQRERDSKGKGQKGSRYQGRRIDRSLRSREFDCRLSQVFIDRSVISRDFGTARVTASARGGGGRRATSPGFWEPFVRALRTPRTERVTS